MGPSSLTAVWNTQIYISGTTGSEEIASFADQYELAFLHIYFPPSQNTDLISSIIQGYPF